MMKCTRTSVPSPKDGAKLATRPSKASASMSPTLRRDIGIEPVARNEHEGRDEAVELVAPDEEARARPLFEPQDALRHLAERIGIDLEQLVARETLEDGDQRLAGMAGG